MGEAAAVVGHGGFGTTMAALTAGVPQVVPSLVRFRSVRPRAASGGSQHRHPAARRLCVAVTDLPAAVWKILDDHSFIEGARAMAAEIAALPDIVEYLPLLDTIGMRCEGVS